MILNGSDNRRAFSDIYPNRQLPSFQRAIIKHIIMLFAVCMRCVLPLWLMLFENKDF